MYRIRVILMSWVGIDHTVYYMLKVSKLRVSKLKVSKLKVSRLNVSK